MLIVNSSIYALFVVVSAYSLVPTADQRSVHAAKQAEKKAEKEKWSSSPYDNEMTADEQWQHMWELQQLPRTPGTVGGMKSPMTPRTRAFTDLEGNQGGFSNVNTGGNGWYGGQVQAVSPVQEQDEYMQESKGKAKRHTGTAY